MKKYISVLAGAVLSLVLIPAQAQSGMGGGMRGGMMGGGMGMGGSPSAPSFGGDMAKIFGENSACTANIEVHTPGGANGAETVMPGKLAYLDGISRFEMDMTEMKGGNMTPQSAAMMKQVGMDKIITISRPDKKTTLLIYPGLHAYVENPMQDADAAKPASAYKSQTTELGKETVHGHACVKNKVVVTDPAGKTHESTVWNATDLENFPVKIETSEGGRTTTMFFKAVKLDRADAAQFEPPSGFKKYDNLMTMMQQEMMNRMGGPRGRLCCISLLLAGVVIGLAIPRLRKYYKHRKGLKFLAQFPNAPRDADEGDA